MYTHFDSSAADEFWKHCIYKLIALEEQFRHLSQYFKQTQADAIAHLIKKFQSGNKPFPTYRKSEDFENI